MTTYLINFVLCSLMLYFAYILLLENENIHSFKRAYLLFSLVFSMTIPLIPLNVNVFAPQTTETAKQEAVIFNGLEEIHHTVNESIEQTATTLSGNLQNNIHLNYLPIAGIIYLLVTATLFIRFLRNIFSIVKLKRHGIELQYPNAGIILIKEKIIPHSFGKYMFINKEDYENGQITEEIIIHEWSHIRQRHFLDIIFMELLIIFFWFNPILYLYRNKIKLNHEFLADNAVIRKNKNIPYYQTLLIRMADQQNSSIITSSLNFSLIKKRLIMMTKTTSKKRAYCRKLALIPVFFAAIGFFTAKIAANVLSERLSEVNETTFANDTVIIPGKGVSLEELNEYKEIVNKYYDYSDTVKSKRDNSKEIKYKWKSMFLSDEDYNRLYVLYVLMDSAQRKEQFISFSGILTVMKLRSPNVDEWNNCKRKNTIFLDGEKIEASRLDVAGRKSIAFFTYNNQKSTSFLWTKKGYNDYIQKYGRQITQSKLLETQAFVWIRMGYILPKG